MAGRRADPVFLTCLRPSPARAPAAGDICPLTGHARLSYRRMPSCSSRGSADRSVRCRPRTGGVAPRVRLSCFAISTQTASAAVG